MPPLQGSVAEENTLNLSDSTLLWIVEHIFMPVKITQAEDKKILHKERVLATLVAQVAHQFKQFMAASMSSSEKKCWKIVTRALRRVAESHQNDGLSSDEVAQICQSMKIGDVYPLLIRAQNAGIIIRMRDEFVSFESFEASPPVDAVMRTSGRLKTTFPAAASEIPKATFDNELFRNNLCSFLAQMDVDLLDSGPESFKAGQKHKEVRDTADPVYITTLLSEILRGLGRQAKDVISICKAMRDDVLWDSALKPWRRSSLWALIRISIQSTVVAHTGSALMYKHFMIYLLAQIADKCAESSIDSSTLTCMSIKIARRLNKLGEERLKKIPLLTDLVMGKQKVLKDVMQTRWDFVIDQQRVILEWDVKKMDPERHTALTLLSCTPYLSSLRPSISQSGTSGVSSLSPNVRLRQSNLFDQPDTALAPEALANPLVLIEFEAAVLSSLQDWTRDNLYKDGACHNLFRCMQLYHAAAEKTYVHDPCDVSVMFLTLFRLWKSLDEIALAQCPLLEEYSPELPAHALEKLLLRHEGNMDECVRLTHYLNARHEISKEGSVFEPKFHHSSFGVRFFANSSSLQALEIKILADAEISRAKKLAQLHSMNEECRNLQAQAQSMSCEFTYKIRTQKYRHKKNCAKCSLNKRVDRMEIMVDEWPLPEDPTLRKAACFELAVPPSVLWWRNATLFMSQQVCTTTEARASVSIFTTILDYDGLKDYSSTPPESAVTAGSVAKDFLHTHYKNVKIPASENQVCVPNGLKLRLFDTTAHAWAGRVDPRSSIHTDSCSFKLDKEDNCDYTYMQGWLQSTNHTSNEVVAKVSSRPMKMSPLEHIAFGSLRCGARIQWQNILRTIVERSINFRRESSSKLICQTIWQIGPIKENRHEWHIDLQNPGFCRVLLHQLELLLLEVQDNWISKITMRSIIYILLRLIIGNNDPTIDASAQTLLKRCRQVCFDWLQSLVEQISATDASKEDNTTALLQDGVFEVGMLCRQTFDFAAFSPTDVEDIAIFYECGIRVQHSKPSGSQYASDLMMLFARDRRVTHRVESMVAVDSKLFQSGMNLCITRVWPAFKSEMQWKRLKSTRNHWITSQTSATERSEAQAIHLDLLFGTLLVEGFPIGRLPTSITSSAIYLRIFGKRVLDVLPSSWAGMVFATKEAVGDEYIHFGYRDSELIVQSESISSLRVYEYIPPERLCQELPVSLAEDFLHWMDLDSRVIEFKTMTIPWKLSVDQWKLHFRGDGSSSLVNSKGARLADCRSTTYRKFKEIFGPLESFNHCFVTFSEPRGRWEIELPRLQLKFHLNAQGDLESLNLSRIVDREQFMGTLHGLKNFLILRDTNASSVHSRRSILIPKGKIDYQASECGHTEVSIQMETGKRRVSFFHYHIDTMLQRITGDETLTSRLYLINLHAVTTSCLPDGLTGVPGFEEATAMLQSASTFSFQSMNADDLGLLSEIASLTPRLHWYPDYLQKMRTVRWSNLPALSQQSIYREVAQEVYTHAGRSLLAFDAEDEKRQTYEDFSQQLCVNDPVSLLERFKGQMQSFSPVLDRSNTSFQNMHHDDVIHKCFRTKLQQDFVHQVSESLERWISTIEPSHHLLSLLESMPSRSLDVEEECFDYASFWIRETFPSLKSWLELYEVLRTSSQEELQFKLVFTLGAMAMKVSDKDLLGTILAFAIGSFEACSPADWRSADFRLSLGYTYQKDQLRSILARSAVPFDHQDLYGLVQGEEESEDSEDSEDFEGRRFRHYESLLRDQVEVQLNHLITQWPTRRPSLLQSSATSLLRSRQSLPDVQSLFLKWSLNRDFNLHIQVVQSALDRFRHLSVKSYAVTNIVLLEQHTESVSEPFYYRHMRQLMDSMEAVTLTPPPELRVEQLLHESPILSLTPNVLTLEMLFSQFREAGETIQELYGDGLQSSLIRLQQENPPKNVLTNEGAQHIVKEFSDAAAVYLDKCFDDLKNALLPQTFGERALEQSGLWMRMTPQRLLMNLWYQDLSSSWRSTLRQYAIAIICRQAAERLWRSSQKSLWLDQLKELEGWLPPTSKTSSTDLLIQIDGNFGIRAVQKKVCDEMTSPSSGKNLALQLNMGEGKSAVIVPCAASDLANGKTLVRVVVLKSLANQMFDILRSRVTGLAGRRIYYAPFSRRTSLTRAELQAIRAIFSECTRMGGIIVVQPEHILSLKLTVMAQLLQNYDGVSLFDTASNIDLLLELQEYLDEHCRDILDESDEILHVRYQLVYTYGHQQSLEGGPDRWKTIQDILALVYPLAIKTKTFFPQGIIVGSRQDGNFPLIRILNKDAGNHLINQLLTEILSNGLDGCRLQFQSNDLKHKAASFISRVDVNAEDFEDLRNSLGSSESWNKVLLLRGLIAHDIIFFVFKEKRFRVDYGLDLERSYLAVPYRAKDVPSLKSEFGHPDVLILLTCLSYYYRGLSEYMLSKCLDIILHLDDAVGQETFAYWTIDATALPPGLRQLTSINLSDARQLRVLHAHLNSNRKIINFYMNNIVFPGEAKEFPYRLATTAWDLAEEKTRPITGFSGTKDGQYLLPSSIQQRDSVGQDSTNAKVLEYIIRSENNAYSSFAPPADTVSVSEFIIGIVASRKREVRVILDVGAQFLDLQNFDLASYWLEQVDDEQVEAAVYFDGDDLAVVTREGTHCALISSVYKDRLGACLIYLDDSHTRGTDLRLPDNYRAAVTLGPKVTKDRLLQGCMRMRKLAHGQTVMFLAPQEVDLEIRTCAGKDQYDQIGTIDVLRWSMLQTIAEIKNFGPQWIQQGLRHHQRQRAASGIQSQNFSSKNFADVWKERECKTLEELYGPKDSSRLSGNETLTGLELNHLRVRSAELGIVAAEGCRMNEEQEREVSHEIEREQQMERDVIQPPALHSLHTDVKRFVKTGLITPNSPAFVSTLHHFKSFPSASIRQGWSDCLLATMDCMTTISSLDEVGQRNHLRPINWLVSSKKSPYLVALSPFEVNELISILRTSTVTHLHMYSPRTGLTMQNIDDLRLFCTPPLPVSWPGLSPDITTSLNLSAGQLMCTDYEAYVALCQFLGLHYDPDAFVDGTLGDGFIPMAVRTGPSRFEDNPIPLLKSLVHARRYGLSSTMSHLGQVLDGRILKEATFDRN